MNGQPSLVPGQLFHIYNRGNNREDLFRTREDYAAFLGFYAKHTTPICETLAYCLLRNHFHLLLRVRDSTSAPEASQGLGNLFNAYAKRVNRNLGRTGSLFESPFRRKVVGDIQYAQRLVVYLHLNPLRHGFTLDFRTWPWSSYATLASGAHGWLAQGTVTSLFGSKDAFVAAHETEADEALESQDYW